MTDLITLSKPSNTPTSLQKPTLLTPPSPRPPTNTVSKLVNNSGEIQIPGIKELVAPLTDEERARYEAINVTVKDFDDAVGAAITLHEDKVNTVSGRLLLRIGRMGS